MRVKRFVAPTVQEAMVKVKLDMGQDAVIIHTRKFKEGGFFGLFGKVMFEVTAAVEEQSKKSIPMASPVQVPVPARKVMSVPNTEGDHDGLLQNELSEMKGMLQEVREQLENNKSVADYPRHLQKFYQIMLDSEMDDKLARKFLKNLQGTLETEQADEETIKDRLEMLIQKALKKAKPINFKKNGEKHVIALVGPTGVGKTTTIAKLAATFSIVDKKKVALITADTYRIAAVEQLKTFGEIIGVPVDVAYTPQELKAAVENHKDKELILIDTAGRSHKNVMQMSELRGFLDAVQPTDIFLVLSATTKSKDMLAIIESYQDIPLSRFIFTKLDETTNYGAILNMVNCSKIALSYVTLGQSVPDDIEVADTVKIAKMIIGERS